MTARILVVDDEPDLEALVAPEVPRGRSATASSTFLFADDGVEALDVIGRDPGHRPGADRHQHAAHGRADAARAACRSARTGCRPIIVSAYGDMANIRTAMNRGAFDFLTKPIDFADLEATIAKTLRHVGDLREARAGAARRPSGRMRRWRATSRPTSPPSWPPPTAPAPICAARGARSPSMFTDIAGFTALVETAGPATCSARSSTTISAA